MKGKIILKKKKENEGQVGQHTKRNVKGSFVELGTAAKLSYVCWLRN